MLGSSVLGRWSFANLPRNHPEASQMRISAGGYLSIIAESLQDIRSLNPQSKFQLINRDRQSGTLAPVMYHGFTACRRREPKRRQQVNCSGWDWGCWSFCQRFVPSL